jgi:glycosyltransferase involved in cell wall biosynthesis
LKTTENAPASTEGAGPRPLRVAEIASCGSPVHHGVGESVEQLLALLCDELTERGHQVTLFATGNSRIRGELRWLYERGYEEWDELWDWQFAEYTHVADAYAQAAELDFDVIHCHSYQYGLPFTPFVRTPNVHTHHVVMDPVVIEQYARYPELQVVVASGYQAQSYTALRSVELIPHGIETDAFPFGERGGDYLLFLGRMIEDKGPAEAVQIARAAGMPLVLAGPEEEGFDERVAPLIDGNAVRYVGRVAPPERDRLLAGAAALVYPIRAPEPFGLVMAEANACGTPVLGVGIGAVPELVEPGVTGYVADRWQDLAALVPAALELDRRRIRERAVQRFDYRRMVDRHEQLYHRLAARATPEGAIR